jgi:hypothetical protein
LLSKRSIKILDAENGEMRIRKKNKINGRVVFDPELGTSILVYWGGFIEMVRLYAVRTVRVKR